MTAHDKIALLHEIVTNQIITQLEEGCFPWVQPWASREPTQLGLPQNAATGRTYSGISILLLWLAAMEQNRSTQRWLTFRQALSLGGAVRMGETGTMIVHADTFVPRAVRERAVGAGEQPRRVGFLKRHNVFHVSQCDGLPPDPIAVHSPGRSNIIPRVGAVIEATGADIRVGGDRAFYAPGPDFVQVPPQEAYYEPVNWYRTKLHELGHWTGHVSRLARDFSGCPGGYSYAREELVAELCSAFLCAELGVIPSVRHADYLGAWLEVLKTDNRAIFSAASLASKAATHVLDGAVGLAIQPVRAGSPA